MSYKRPQTTWLRLANQAAQSMPVGGIGNVVVCGITILPRLFDPGDDGLVAGRPARRHPQRHHRSSYTQNGAQCRRRWRLRLWAASVSEATHRALSEQSERGKGLQMPKVKYISSPNEIPAGHKYVLVMYGEESAQTRHPLGLTITVANTVSISD
jgi:hypothetical protein